MLRQCCSQFQEEQDINLEKNFWRALGVFIRLKVFPRIRQDRVFRTYVRNGPLVNPTARHSWFMNHGWHSSRFSWAKAVHFNPSRSLWPQTVHFRFEIIQSLILWTPKGQQVFSIIRKGTQQRVYACCTKTRQKYNIGPEIRILQ